MGLVPWHTFSRSYVPILHSYPSHSINMKSPYVSVSTKKALKEAGFLESYTLNVPHPPNIGNLQSLQSNLGSIKSLSNLGIDSSYLMLFGTYDMSKKFFVA
ncbi:hypothetical protein C4D60_Mb03t05040 [Musa balbisiana]|uniref:Uncharacterized protein n=1 Tax=Musa balbisiana TaxID=52838 RepID=A0A4S8JA22_MUSBA|nr:hypothetical protein C4D60_Mb03t05040 [Musa balbisiana]